MGLEDLTNGLRWQGDGVMLITFQAFDAAHNLLQTVAAGSLFPTYVPVSVSGISRIEMLQPLDGWGWSLDNLSCETVAVTVPEPATMALFGAGLLGLGLLSRHRKCAAA